MYLWFLALKLMRFINYYFQSLSAFPLLILRGVWAPWESIPGIVLRECEDLVNSCLSITEETKLPLFNVFQWLPVPLLYFSPVTGVFSLWELAWDLLSSSFSSLLISIKVSILMIWPDLSKTLSNSDFKPLNLLIKFSLILTWSLTNTI